MPVGLGNGLSISLDRVESGGPVVPSAPTYFGSGGVSANTSTTTISPALPASMLTNDIILVEALCLGSNTAFDIPAGYTEVIQFNVDTHRVGWWWKRHTGTETAQAVVNSGRTSTNLLAGQVTARRGCIATGTPYEGLVSLAQPVSGSLVGLDVTTLDVNRLAEQNFMALGVNVAYTSSGSWVENLDQGTSGGGGGRFYVANAIAPAATTITADTLTGSNALYGVIGLAWKAA